MTFSKETASEAGRKSVEVRRQRKSMTPAERVKELAAASADVAIKDLIKAAKGQEPYDGLSAKERLDAWKTVLAYGVGRPTTTVKGPETPEAPPEEPEEVNLV